MSEGVGNMGNLSTFSLSFAVNLKLLCKIKSILKTAHWFFCYCFTFSTISRESCCCSFFFLWVFYCLYYYSCSNFSPFASLPTACPIPIVSPHTIVCVHGSGIYVICLTPSPSSNRSPPPWPSFKAALYSIVWLYHNFLKIVTSNCIDLDIFEYFVHVYLFIYFQYILLIMLLQFSQFFLIYPPSTLHPPTLHHSPLSSCPWVVCISSLISLFPKPFLTSSLLFYAYQLCFLFFVHFLPYSSPPLPHRKPSLWCPFLWFCSCSSCLLSICSSCCCF